MISESQPDSGSDTLRVLMLEDTAADAELCESELTASGLDFVSLRVDTQPAFEQAFEQFLPDLIISDFSLPGAFDGLAALDIARAREPDTPFIFVSGTIGEERAVEAMKRGATDYVLKDRLERLVPVITRALKERSERLALRKAQLDLGEARERLERILGSLRDVVWSVSSSPRRVLYLNPAAEEVYGRPTEALLGAPALLLSLVHEDDRQRVSLLWQRAFEGQAFEAEYRIVGPDGDHRWLHDRGNPVTDAGGRVIRVDGIARDITGRRNNEDRIARLSRVRSVLSGINSAIVRIKASHPLYEEVCRIAVDQGGFTCAWIGKLEPETLAVTPKACSGGCDGNLLAAVSLCAKESEPHAGGLIGLALRTRRPVSADDAALDYPLFQLVEKPREQQSIAVLPLFVDNDVVAVLFLYAREKGFFDADEMKLLRELAGNISFALDSIDKASRLDYLAYYDGLTGLANRQLFHDRLEQLVARGVAEQTQVVVMVIDLERFRNINETLGIAAGDRVLKSVADRLVRAAGALGTAARINADLFALALPSAAQHADAVPAVVDEIVGGLQAPIDAAGEVLTVQSKAGIALFPSDGDNAAALFANAEAALKKAKRSRERFLFYAREMNARVAVLLKLENQLRKALREEEFVLYYQPRVLLSTQQIVGLEALLRWKSPELGLVSPADFIPLLEETGLILDVGRWAFHRAVADRERWRAGGCALPSIGVNVSAIQLRQKDFIEQITSAFVCPDRSEDAFEIELTESMIMSDVEGSAAKLREIRAAGIRIAIDDFGTGYSSLGYLVKLPIDTLKIDRTFVADMSSSPEHMAIVRTIVSLAESLRLRIIAEGVETKEQASMLRLLRCDEAQGYLYSPPVPPEAMEEMLPRLTRAAEKDPSAGGRFQPETLRH